MKRAWQNLERLPINERHFARVDTPRHRWADGPRDPYWHAGSHPDCVERVWDKLGGTLPEDCRFLLLGRPVLAHPKTAFVFAMPFGTQYALWLPHPEFEKATRKGLPSHMTWSGGETTHLDQELGEGWLFGRFEDDEVHWVAAAYRAAGLRSTG